MIIQLSFVIPAFNCEKYIEQCIRSLLNQDVPSSCYEIIAVNDGSTDKTPLILESIAEHHSNIHVYHQDNQGRHIARNNGAEYAKGKYIWFIDNDDIVSNKCVGEIVRIADKLSLDVLAVAPPKPFTDSFPSDFDIESDVTKVMSGKDFLINGASYWAPWQFVINRDFYTKKRFQFRLRYFLEDIELMFRIFYFAQRIAEFSHFSCYSYIKRPESETMSPWTVNKIIDYARYINFVDEFIREDCKEDQIINQFEILRTQFYLNALNNWKTIRHEMPLQMLLDKIKHTPHVTYGKILDRIYQKIAMKYPSLFVKIK